MDRSSKNFFLIFFVVIFASVALIYIRMYIMHDYIQFYSYDDVPTFEDMYKDAQSSLLEFFEK